MSALLERLDAASWDTLNQAVRKVLERHQDDGDGYCTECSYHPGAEEPVPFPCATVQDITEALEETA